MLYTFQNDIEIFNSHKEHKDCLYLLLSPFYAFFASKYFDCLQRLRNVSLASTQCKIYRVVEGQCTYTTHNGYKG